MSKFKIGDIVKIIKPSTLYTEDSPEVKKYVHHKTKISAVLDLGLGEIYQVDIDQEEHSWCEDAFELISSDNVNHPSHYTDGKIEVIDYIEDKKLCYHLGNAVKYISRAGKKNNDTYVEDLKQAIWYIGREIRCYEKGSCEHSKD